MKQALIDHLGWCVLWTCLALVGWIGFFRSRDGDGSFAAVMTALAAYQLARILVAR